tara:strand:- start:504 stop:677 length:174 start_codon:yes stop_codon:yes gene_type:complete
MDNLIKKPQNNLTLSEAFLKVREDIIFIQNENMRLLESNNQLKQAIAALNKEPTNSL